MTSKFRKFCQQGLRSILMDVAYVSLANMIRLNVNLMNSLISEDAAAWWRLFTTNTWLLALRWSPIQVLSEYKKCYPRNRSYLVEKWKIYWMLHRYLTQRGNWSGHEDPLSNTCIEPNLSKNILFSNGRVKKQFEQKQNWMRCENPPRCLPNWTTTCIEQAISADITKYIDLRI